MKFSNAVLLSFSISFIHFSPSLSSPNIHFTFSCQPPLFTLLCPDPSHIYSHVFLFPSITCISSFFFSPILALFCFIPKFKSYYPPPSILFLILQISRNFYLFYLPILSIISRIPYLLYLSSL